MLAKNGSASTSTHQRTCPLPSPIIPLRTLSPPSSPLSLPHLGKEPQPVIHKHHTGKGDKKWRTTRIHVHVRVYVSAGSYLSEGNNKECTDIHVHTVSACHCTYSFSLSLRTCTNAGSVHYRMHYFLQWPHLFCRGVCHFRNIKARATVTCRKLDMKCSMCTGELVSPEGALLGGPTTNPLTPEQAHRLFQYVQFAQIFETLFPQSECNVCAIPEMPVLSGRS